MPHAPSTYGNLNIYLWKFGLSNYGNDAYISMEMWTIYLFLFALMLNLPNQQFFSHVGMILCLPGLNQH